MIGLGGINERVIRRIQAAWVCVFDVWMFQKMSTLKLKRIKAKSN